MSSFKNSQFGKRLRASNKTVCASTPRKKRRRPENFSSPTKLPSKRMKSLSGAVIDVTNTPSKRRKARLDCGDRFVPSRDQNSIQASYSLEENSIPRPSLLTPARSHGDPAKDHADHLYKSVLRSELAGIQATPSPSGRIFAYHSPGKFPTEASPENLENPLDHSYQISPETRLLINQPRPHIRNVTRVPYRVLDAPDLEDNFYNSLLDWSPSGVLAVGLRQGIYFWRADNCRVDKLPTNPFIRYVSLAWMQTAPTIAVGTTDGDLEIYDVSTLQRIRTYPNAHDCERIGSLSWTSSTLTSGSRDQTIKHWDIRDSVNKPFKQSDSHAQEVCGVKWSSDKGVQSSLLASGGNDGRLCIWDLRSSMREAGSGVGSSLSAQRGAYGVGGPVYKFRQSKAAVRALAWDPHISSVLASGSGAHDQCIRFWNTSTGVMLDEINTGSQVCSLAWSINTHELVSAHGYGFSTTANQICIWKYSTKEMVTSLVGHAHRVQYVALSPSGDTIVSGSGDQTLRFWNVFPPRLSQTESEESALNYGKLIR